MRNIAGFCLMLSLMGGHGFVMAAAEAEAEDGDEVELREETRCFPAKNLIGYFNRFDGLDTSRTDTLEAIFDASFEVKDGGGFPDRVYLSLDDQEIDLVMDETGNLPDFVSKAKVEAEDSELCIQDKARVGTPVSELGAQLNVPVNIQFKSQSGAYDMAEIIDGLKDGKTFYKKMISGPASLLVPKMTHLMISYEAEDVPFGLTAFNGDAVLEAPIHEDFGGGYVLRLKDLKKAGVTRLEVSGGAHNLSPTPSIKIMEKYGFGGG